MKLADEAPADSLERLEKQLKATKVAFLTVVITIILHVFYFYADLFLIHLILHFSRRKEIAKSMSQTKSKPVKNLDFKKSGGLLEDSITKHLKKDELEKERVRVEEQTQQYLYALMK